MILFLSAVLALFLSESLNALKLTLNQDLTDLPRKLSPEEIGQFLHSIKDLPKLAEYLDPRRSKINLDLLYFYNNYGCSEDRIFNWDRISAILSYGGLSREDRSLLLNGQCLMKWPGLFTIDRSQLVFLLNLFPESNPLLQISESDDLSFWENNVSIYRGGLSTTLLDNAQNSSRHLNFVPKIGKLFKQNLIILSNLGAPNNYRFSLIGPEVVDHCFLKSRIRANRQECSSMVFGNYINYRNFSNRDLFYWSLNIPTAVKYNHQSRNVLKILGYYTSLLGACPWYEAHLIHFIKGLSSIICDYIEEEVINSESIYKLIESLCNWDRNSYQDKYALDPLFMVVEFYNWIDANSEYFEIDPKVVWKSLKLIQRTISRTINIAGNEFDGYYLKFLISTSVSSKYFRNFLRNNYKTDVPNGVLLETFKTISLKSPVLSLEIKALIDLKIRLQLLRKRSFDHPNHFVADPSIRLYISEDVPISKSLFEGVYESLLENCILVFPLDVNVTESSFIKGLFKNSEISDIKFLLKRFWNCLGHYANAFFEMKNDDHETQFDYPPELLPNPWTYPNVLLAAGCTMTLALLHGVKLEGWSLKWSLFETIFKISPKPDNLEEDHFITFSTLNGCIDSVNFFNDEIISDSIKELISVPVEKRTKKLLRTFQNNLLKIDSEGSYNFSSESAMVWSSKVFSALDNIRSDTDQDNLFHVIKTDLLSDLTEEELNYHWSKMTVSDFKDKSKNSRVEMAKVQIYSLYVGFQPLTRFLKPIEAYDLIFSMN